jgi:hypothetical protein
LFSEGIAALGLHTQWDDLITAMGGDASSIALIKGVIATESQWNPNAINPSDPSYGLMQILGGPRGPYPSVAVADLMDPSTNITLGSTFLQNQIRRFSFPGGVAAYNSGTPRTLPGGQYVNQAYVDSVLSYQSYYLNAMLGTMDTSIPPDAVLNVTGTYTGEPATADWPLDVPTDVVPGTEPGISPGWTTGLPSLSLDLGIAMGLGVLGLAVVLMGGTVKRPRP